MSIENQSNSELLKEHADRISDSLLEALNKTTPLIELLMRAKNSDFSARELKVSALSMALLKLAHYEKAEIVQLASAGKQWVAMGMCDLESDSTSSNRTVEILNEIRAGRANKCECPKCKAKASEATTNEQTRDSILAEIEAEMA